MAVEEVERYVTKDGGTETDVRQAFFSLKNIWNSEQLTKNTSVSKFCASVIESKKQLPQTYGESDMEGNKKQEMKIWEDK